MKAVKVFTLVFALLAIALSLAGLLTIGKEDYAPLLVNLGALCAFLSTAGLWIGIYLQRKGRQTFKTHEPL